MSKIKPLVFTGFNNSWLDFDDSNLDIAIAQVKELQKINIPIVPISFRTFAEIRESLCSLGIIKECLFSLGAIDPIVVEYGSAIILQSDRADFDTPDTETEGDFAIYKLGCTYIEARAVLKVIQSTIRINNLRGFGDLDEAELASLTDMSLAEIKQVKTRKYSEMFVNPKSVSVAEMAATAEEFGCKIVEGEGISTLLGAEASITESINYLCSGYKAGNAIAFGIGNSKQDLEMLQAVDKPIWFGEPEKLDPYLESRCQVTSSNDLAGWIEAINIVLDESIKVD